MDNFIKRGKMAPLMDDEPTVRDDNNALDRVIKYCTCYAGAAAAIAAAAAALAEAMQYLMLLALV